MPQRITFIYAVFLYLALLLGSLGGFYDTVAEWDTMGDLIVNCTAAAIVAVLGYFALKSSGNWLEAYLITFDTETKNNETD